MTVPDLNPGMTAALGEGKRLAPIPGDPGQSLHKLLALHNIKSIVMDESSQTAWTGRRGERRPLAGRAERPLNRTARTGRARGGPPRRRDPGPDPGS